jgi:hypothetical protein
MGGDCGVRGYRIGRLFFDVDDVSKVTPATAHAPDETRATARHASPLIAVIASLRPGFRRRAKQKAQECPMSEITYEIVEHDGGWAYKVDGVFSETFPTHAAALKAARMAADEQKIPGETEVIEFEDADGKWHTETARGNDRPSITIKDTA